MAQRKALEKVPESPVVLVVLVVLVVRTAVVRKVPQMGPSALAMDSGRNTDQGNLDCQALDSNLACCS